MTKEDHEAPSNAELIAEDPDDPYEEQGSSLSRCGNCGPDFQTFLTPIYSVNLLLLTCFCLVSCSFRPDPAQWRHQLELPVSGRHGQRTLWLPVQGGLFLLPLQQGRGEGLRVHRQLPQHAGVHAEVP